ncbi:MAG: glycosyltransferase family 2 protein [Parcubacteria group bacterium]
MNPKLSIIIVNYQSEKYLAKCIFSIKEKILAVEYEIIVVNNDDLDIQCPSEARLINTGKNIGFGAACNLGARMAQGEILCFLNPDTEIVSENILNLLSEFEKDKKLAIVGPRLVRENGKTQWWCAGEEFTLWRLIKNNIGLIDSKKIWESQKDVAADWVSGAALFVKKEIFEKVEGFDEDFFMYFEDIDLCRRARQLGYKVLYFPKFTIKHFGGKSFLDKKTQKAYYYKSQRRYFRKYFLKY